MDAFTQNVLDQFSKEITDQVFLFIQNDRKLMHEYLKLINKNDRHYVNGGIAKAICKRYGLTNSYDRQETPKSTLIQSYSELG